MHIFLLRHGETLWNVSGRVQGQRDIALNETGKAQARTVAPMFAGYHFDALISSDLHRAVETGSLVSAQAVIGERIQDRRITEKNFGICEGMDITERRRLYPGGHAPGEEDTDAVCRRMKEAMADYGRRYSGDVLVVGHGSATSLLMKELVPECRDSILLPHNLALTILRGQDLKVEAYDLTGSEEKDWLDAYACVHGYR